MTDDRALLRHALRTGSAVTAADLSTGTIAADLVRAVLKEEATVEEGRHLDPAGLRLDGTTLEGDLDLANMHNLPQIALLDVTITGHLNLSNSTINGGLNIEGGAVRAQLNASGLRVRRHVFINSVDFGYTSAEERTYKGVIILSRASIGDYLQLLVDVDDISLSDAKIGGGNGTFDGEAITIGTPESSFASVDLNRSSLDSKVSLVGGFRRGIALRGVRVRGDLDLAGARVTGPIYSGRLTDERLYVDAREVVAETLFLPSEAPGSGGVDLTAADIDRLVVHVTGMDDRPVSPRVDATSSWRVGSLEMVNVDRRPEPTRIPPISSDDAACLVEWLPSGGHDAFPVMAWRSLATALDAEGRADEARWLRIEAADRHKRSTARSIWARASRVITKSTIGHGYSPFRALGWLVGLWAVSTALAMVAWRYSEDAFVNRSDVAEPPGLWDFLYGLDIVVSPVGSFQADIWAPTWWWLALAFWVLKVASYALFGLFIAGITGRAMKTTDAPTT